MKSLAFGPGSPWKASTRWFYLLLPSFVSFDKSLCWTGVYWPGMAISHPNKPVFVNPTRLSATSCQTIFLIKPVFYHLVWLWLHVARMIIRCSSQPGMTCYIHQHCMVGVINTQDFSSHPYYNQVGKPTIWFNIIRMIYFIFWYCYSFGYLPGLVLGIMTGGKLPGQIFLCRHKDCMKLSRCISKHSKYHGGSNSVM